MAGIHHTVEPGDSTTKLAFESGLFPDSVWNHAENSQLKSQRKDLNVLHPGDVLFLPEKVLKEESCATEQHHKFKRKGVPEKLNVQFLDLYGKPLANKPYKLDLDGTQSRGSLDGDGRLSIYIPPNARQGRIEVGPNGALATMDLNLGHLDPVSELSGVQARLKNLGFYNGPLDGAASEQTDAAVLAFRNANGLEAKAEINDELRNKLKQVHGI
jgi:N-acetylmuramoyl-L-alanine amidase